MPEIVTNQDIANLSKHQKNMYAKIPALDPPLTPVEFDFYALGINRHERKARLCYIVKQRKHQQKIKHNDSAATEPAAGLPASI